MDRTVAETIETLTERLQTSTLLEDRRDASRGLKSLSKDHRVEVCAQSLDTLLSAIKNDRHETELVTYCLDSLNYIISGSLADSPAATWPDTNSDRIGADDHDPGRELAEIFLKNSDNLVTILDLLTNDDFKTRWISVRILCGLARHTLVMVQDSILSFPTGLSSLTPLLAEEQELIRNDALMLFVKLTQSNTYIQNLVVFENCYEKIMYIINLEGYFDGTIAVVMDCLHILSNLTVSNESNQVLFRDAGNIQKLLPFFDNIQTLQWTPERSACLTLVLRLVDSLIVTTNSPVHIQASQDIMQRCGLLDKVCEILTCPFLPITVIAGAMITASNILQGNLEQNANIVVQTNTMMPVLLLSMVKEMCKDIHRSIINRQ